MARGIKFLLSFLGIFLATSVFVFAEGREKRAPTDQIAEEAFIRAYNEHPVETWGAYMQEIYGTIADINEKLKRQEALSPHEARLWVLHGIRTQIIDGFQKEKREVEVEELPYTVQWYSACMYSREFVRPRSACDPLLEQIAKAHWDVIKFFREHF